MRCISCGYDLKGIAPEGKCPECGVVVDRLFRKRLEDLGPQLLHRLQRGAWLILLSVLLLVLGFPASLLLLDIAGSRGIGVPLFCIATCVAAYGVGWLHLFSVRLTLPAYVRSTVSTPIVSTGILLLVVSGFCSIAGLFGVIDSALASGGQGGLGSIMLIGLPPLVCATPILIVVHHACVMWWLSEVRVELPGYPLARRARTLIWLVPLGGAASVGMLVLLHAVIGRTASPIDRSVLIMSALPLFASLVPYVHTLWVFRQRTTKALRASESSMNAEKPKGVGR